jgi:Nucleotidyltransferase/DNA polymerase involved in DNA repair
MTSPYEGLSIEQWKSKTQELIENHPLHLEVIREIALKSWDILWQTTIGEGELAIPLYSLDVPAMVVGYFFEKLFAKELQKREPQLWRGGVSKEEKDLVYISDQFYSIEIKTSGQLGLKIFGNRSYGQSAENPDLAKKEKSGYYITVNFYDRIINLIRFGWIDHSDWKAQSSESGQAAGLSEKIYTYKLIPIAGEYRLNTPVTLLKGIGEKTAKIFEAEGIKTVRELQNYQGVNQKLLKFKQKLEDLELS